MPRSQSHSVKVTLAVAAALAASGGASRALATTYVNDSLTAPTFMGRSSQGGSFGPNGFTTSAASDSVWYEITDAIPSGRVEYTITGLSLATTLREADNDIFTIYQAPTGVTEPIPYWPWRNNDFKVFTRIFGVAETERPGAMKLELAGCPRGEPWWHDDACPDSCASIAGIAYAASGHDVGWDASASYRMAIEWGGGNMTFFRDGVALGTVSYPGTFAPQPTRIRIGTPRNTMPVGVTVRDVLITGTAGPRTPICTSTPPPSDAGAPPIPDAGPSACDPVIQADMLSPASGSGSGARFVASYRNCYGASAFRIVQLWVGERVDAAVPHIQVGYEAGRLFLETDSCAPGDAHVLMGTYGSLDCARTTAVRSGNDLTMTWAVDFNTTTFAGPRSIFFDAKGPSSMTPEPRLGWTRMGSFVVAAATADGGTPPDLDASTLPDAAAGMDARPADAARLDGGLRRDDSGVEGGCGCSLAGAGGTNRRAAFALAGLAALARARRRRSRSRG